MSEPNPTCQELLEYLASYLDGELPEGELKILELHLQQCPPCIEYLDTYKAAIQLAQTCIPKLEAEEACEACPEKLIQAILDAQRSDSGD